MYLNAEVYTGSARYTDAITYCNKIIAAGYSYSSGVENFAVARYLPNGTLDTTFGSSGKVTVPFGSGDSEAYVDGTFGGGEETLTFGRRQVNARAYAASFGFRGADQQKKVANLSGGERNRLHLVLLGLMAVGPVTWTTRKRKKMSRRSSLNNSANRKRRVCRAGSCC